MLVDGYRYSKQQVLDGETRWLCTSNKTNNCPAAIYSYTEDNSVLKRVEKHNHAKKEDVLSTQEENVDTEDEKHCDDDDDDDDDTAASGTNTVVDSILEQVENIHVSEGKLSSAEEETIKIHENSNDDGLTFHKGKRGGINLCLDGYIYLKQRARSDKIWWRCYEKSKKCKAYVVTTIDNKFVSRSGQHNHEKERKNLNHDDEGPIFATSYGGDTIMHVGGYNYYKHQVIDGETRWLCVSNKSYNCPGAIYSYTEDNSVFKCVEKHNHRRKKPTEKLLKKIKKDEGIADRENKTKCHAGDSVATCTDSDSTADNGCLKLDDKCKSPGNLSTVEDNNIDRHEMINTDELTFERSRLGGTLLRLEGFTFSKINSNNGKTAWRCSYYKRHNCNATVRTIKTDDETKVYKRSGQHNHLANGKTQNHDEDDEFRWGTSCYGNPIILYKGNKFVLKTKLAKKKWWFCSKNYAGACKASICTVDKTIVKCRDIHNH